MVKIEELPSADNDVTNIASYISNELFNEDAALKFWDNYFTKTIDLNPFPRKYTAYEPFKLLKQEYRRFMIGNYIVFYTVTEDNLVTIARVLHERQDTDNVLT